MQFYPENAGVGFNFDSKTEVVPTLMISPTALSSANDSPVCAVRSIQRIPPLIIAGREDGRPILITNFRALTEAVKFLRWGADENHMDSTTGSRSGGRCWLVGQQSLFDLPLR